MHNRTKQHLKYKTGACTGCKYTGFSPKSIHCRHTRWESEVSSVQSSTNARGLGGRSGVEFRVGGGVFIAGWLLKYMYAIAS